MTKPATPPPGSRWIGRVVLTWDACRTCGHYVWTPTSDRCDLRDAPDAHRLDGDHLECTAWVPRKESIE